MVKKKKTTKNKPAKVKKSAKPSKAKKTKKKVVKKVIKPKKAVKKATVTKVPKAKKVKEAPRTRYSDKELAEFKQLILEKLEFSRKELQNLQEQITRKDGHGTDDTENRFVNMEDGTSTMEREYLNQMAARTRQYIDHLEKAILRIQNKTYGICRVTGKLIPIERLRAVPHATLSIEAKQMQQKKQVSIQPDQVEQEQQEQA